MDDNGIDYCGITSYMFWFKCIIWVICPSHQVMSFLRGIVVLFPLVGWWQWCISALRPWRLYSSKQYCLHRRLWASDDMRNRYWKKRSCVPKKWCVFLCFSPFAMVIMCVFLCFSPFAIWNLSGHSCHDTWWTSRPIPSISVRLTWLSDSKAKGMCTSSLVRRSSRRMAEWLGIWFMMINNGW